MRRAWIAFGIVVALIVVAIVLLLRPQRPKGASHQEPYEPPPKVAIETPVETAKKVVKQPEPKEKAKEVAEPPVKVEPVDSDAVLRNAGEKLAAGKTLEAYRLLSDALLRDPQAKRGAEFRARLTKLSEQVFFSDKVIVPHSIGHTVVRGDTLDKLRASNKTTIELLRRMNGLKGNTLRIGQHLKIVPGGFDVQVDKSDFRLTVTKDGLWVREFKIGLGKNGATPVCECLAGAKLPEPAYTSVFPHVPYGDKKNNPLGTRWITIQGEYGIHGTWEPEAVGKEESKGCVRMLNEDVEWLFDLIVKDSSKIVIRR